MVVYITGASGYLGNALTNYFVEKGENVIALCRKNIFSSSKIQFSYFELGGELEKSLPVPDVCIHCAYDLALLKWDAIYKKNVLGSQKLFEDLLNRGCRQIIHISSMSAYKGCKSNYGKAKLLIEALGVKYNVLSIRPGLIHGGKNAGLIGTLDAISKLPVIPMIGNGNYPQYLTDINSLSSIVYKIIREKYQINQSVISLCTLRPTTFKALIFGLNPGSKKLIIPIFWQIPYYSLRFFELLQFRLPLRSDSILGLVFANPTPDFSFLEKNGIEMR